MFSDIDYVEKINDYKIIIHLKNPNAAIMRSLAMFTVAIVSPTNAEEWGEEAFKHPIGTGPFKFVEWIKDDHITVEANEDYWRAFKLSFCCEVSVNEESQLFIFSKSLSIKD